MHLVRLERRMALGDNVDTQTIFPQLRGQPQCLVLVPPREGIKFSHQHGDAEAFIHRSFLMRTRHPL